MVSPEITHTSNIVFVVYRNIYVCIHTFMYITTINKKRDHEFERTRRGLWEGLRGRKGREK